MKKEKLTYCCRINVTVNNSHFFSACLHHNKKMVRFRAMCVQTLVVTLLFYKATLPTTGVACTLPHFQSLRPDTSSAFNAMRQLQGDCLSKTAWDSLSLKADHTIKKMICLTGATSDVHFVCCVGQPFSLETSVMITLLRLRMSNTQQQLRFCNLSVFEKL